MAGKDRHKSEKLDGEKGKIRNDEGMLKNLEGSRALQIPTDEGRLSSENNPARAWDNDMGPRKL
ncbi:hypothetical protein FPSE_12066 [Fusarium pseudograminearum CS3096]|uniref:Uncharacterized protein n=1 Tax=Fusarium pseudograminearum (strain CS3096) TaxID=1028729 RepID=K3V3Y8_FUSPC|nr:hypothetical protein FPSE_12066 [Fusarium pseudograminearum CS3096]EKJ67757.1 hypothetical protein FPSE_12066 [Fusarium pseudograminearum CS3096]